MGELALAASKSFQVRPSQVIYDQYFIAKDKGEKHYPHIYKVSTKNERL